jgi:ferritin-like metal-binding protein YciE
VLGASAVSRQAFWISILVERCSETPTFGSFAQDLAAAPAAPLIFQVEHYEIARYGTLKTWAQELGLNQSVKLLQATLGEEKKTDETLTQLAESQVNQHAQQAA